MLNKIEKTILFPLVRILGFLLALGFLLGMIYGLFLYFQINSNFTQPMKTYVSFEDVQKSLSPKNSYSVPNHFNPKLNYPESIKKYLRGENYSILEEWLSFYKTDNEKQNFLDNLTMVVQEAEKRDVNVVQYINQYKSIKQDKMDQDTFSISKSIDSVSKLFIIVWIGFGFLIFTTLVVLLLLLSIERNTRKEE